MTQKDLLADLNPEQREAVTHLEGPLLVLAAAGSGKTRVITRRIAYLLEQGIPPSSILAITFTNKAAGEMRQRVEAIVPNCHIWISTFHSFGVRILRQYADQLNLDRNFTIYDQTDRKRLVKMAIEDAGLDNGRFTPDTIQSAISNAKNELKSPNRYAKGAFDYFTQFVSQVYPAYEKRLRDSNALDFDDLLYWPALAMKNNEELRKELDARFRYILIDEYQDTNHAQYAMARGLSADYPNICVVGDPDQSVYAWRGADINNILSFEHDFPSARVLTLGTNYRSTKAILHAAGTLIKHNENRKEKELITENAAGLPVSVLTFENGREEAEGIARRIKRAVETKDRSGYRDFAIFVRVNALTRALEQAFVREQLPYQIVRGLAFFDRKENRDILAYLRVLANPKDDISFERIVNEPTRGIGKTTLKHLRNYASPREISMLEGAYQLDHIPEIKGRARRGLKQFTDMMRELHEIRDTQPHAVIEMTLDKSGYRAMLKDSQEPEDEERLANIEELITAARQFAEEDSNRTIGDFLETITLSSDVDAWDDQEDCVSIMTLHAAKGLEFPVVYMIAVENGILPHQRSLDPDKKNDLEEERRLAFVGMTRAREELYLTHARMRDYRGQTLYAIPSHFLEELPPEVEHADLSSSTHRRISVQDQWRTSGNSAAQSGWEEAGVESRPTPKPRGHVNPTSSKAGPYKVGMLVRHEQYGEGRVIDISGQGVLRTMRIRFAKKGVVPFIVKYAHLEIIEE